MAILIFSQVVFSQLPVKRAVLESFMQAGNYSGADSVLQIQLGHIFSYNQFDSLPQYLMYVGKMAERKKDVKFASSEINKLIERVKSQKGTNGQIARLYNYAAEYYGSLGMNDRAFSENILAYSFAKEQPIDEKLLASINSDMGTYAFRMGDVALSSKHHRSAINYYLSPANKDQEGLYVAANNMGSIMWMTSKMDSALYYFKIALNALSKTDRTPINQYYRPAVLNNNMAALYNMEGNTTRAIEAMNTTIRNLRDYLAIKESVPKKAGTLEFQFEAIDNLGGIYKEIGDYRKAKELLEYSFSQKLKHAGADSSGVYKSQLLLGQLYYAMKDDLKAEEYILRGLNNLSTSGGSYGFWIADACHSLALLYDGQKKLSLARVYYEKADSVYEESFQGEYDVSYLEFLRNASLFYAENNELPVAFTKANKGFQYVNKTQGENNLSSFYQLLNLSEVFLLARDYNRSLEYSKRGLKIVEHISSQSSNLLDSVKTQLREPKAILLKSKANYHLLKDKNESNLREILTELNRAVEILERRKTLVYDSQDIGILLSDHNELLNFIKKITLDLHNLTRDQGYINKLLELHESGIYNRLRSRLDKNDSVKFANVPFQVQQRELLLRKKMSEVLNKNESHQDGMTSYLKAVEEWNGFKEKIKKSYPHYYKLKYESVFRSIDDIQQSIPSSASMVRYIFINDDLYVIVVDKNSKQLFSLDGTGLESKVANLTHYSSNFQQVSQTLLDLYNRLWAPFASTIRNRKIIIVPDGVLFSLNFEILTPSRIFNYHELAKNSLLAKHTISYHYSVHLVGRKKKSSSFKENFVAFVPGFLDTEKARYQSMVKDSFDIDRSYISLLPQPFALNFAAKARSLLGGRSFLNEHSTVTTFKNNAGSHKIIHIGTHAESNNLHPEFSRLIFSKSGNGEQNSVFLHELYNCDLNSELAVLTACESGKPGFQDGEGMISLAHAFNYAGSESIITGLWKIDEKASTIIMENFYRLLLTGMEKDEALREAKLKYLQTEEGRTLAPQFWAGLVLMGDTTPIEFKKQNNHLLLFLSIAFFLGLSAFLFFRKGSSR